MYISNGTELLVSVQVPNVVEILKDILSCTSLKGNATERAIREMINDISSEQNQVVMV
jgi:hypothetical protein